MIRKIIRLVQNNSSIFILATATVAFFLLNVTLKKIIDAADYGRVGLLLTYIALLSSFGLFGSEQLLIRQSEVSKKKKSYSYFSNNFSHYYLYDTSIYIPGFLSLQI